jgi:hypothetical protein
MKDPYVEHRRKAQALNVALSVIPIKEAIAVLLWIEVNLNVALLEMQI